MGFTEQVGDASISSIGGSSSAGVYGAGAIGLLIGGAVVAQLDKQKDAVYAVGKETAAGFANQTNIIFQNAISTNKELCAIATQNASILAKIDCLAMQHKIDNLNTQNTVLQNGNNNTSAINSNLNTINIQNLERSLAQALNTNNTLQQINANFGSGTATNNAVAAGK